MWTRVLTVALAVTLCDFARAIPMGHTSHATYTTDSFWSGLTADPVVDFEGVASGTLIPSGGSVGGLEFEYAISGQTLAIASQFGTTSGTQYLGLDNPDTAFNLGDSFTIHFGKTVRAIGLYVIAGGDTLAGDFELSAGGGVITNAAGPSLSVSDGSAWFLGLVAEDGDLGFSSATLRGVDAGGAFLAFTVDDILVAVPEPGAALLALTAMGALFARPRRHGGSR